jgi:hypothetical protein
MAYRTHGNTVDKIELAPTTQEPIQLQKCLFRVGLWIGGGADAISAPDEDLFIPIAKSR